LALLQPTHADYASTVLADSPEAYYRFEETSGAAMDSSGNGHHMKWFANASFGHSGRIGRCAKLSAGGMGFLDLTNDPAAGDFSVELIVALASNAPPAVIVSQYGGSGVPQDILLHTSSGYLGSELGLSEADSSFSPGTQEWYHVVMTYNADGPIENLHFYVDGVAVGTDIAPTVYHADGNWLLGCRHPPDDGMYGWLDEAAIYTYRLDDPNGDNNMADSRVAAHFAALPPNTYYVAPDGDAQFPYADWANAFSNIQDAVDETIAGDMVLVTNGVYDRGGGVAPGGTCSNRVVITNDITVRGVDDRDLTIIKGAEATGGGTGPDAVRGDI